MHDHNDGNTVESGDDDVIVVDGPRAVDGQEIGTRRI